MSNVSVTLSAINYDDVFTASTQSGYYGPVGSSLSIAAQGVEVDLSQLQLNNSWYLSVGYGVTLDADTASLSHLRGISGGGAGNNNLLQTSAASFDLTQINIGNLAIASTNAAGTTFTVANYNTGLNVIGGPGNDTLVGQGFAFTSGQRAAIFAQGSVETIQDTSGTYTAPDFIRSPTDSDPAANTIAEGAANGSSAGLTASSSYHFGDVVTYSLTADTSGGGFFIDPTSGIVSVADGSKLDYESSSGSYQLTVQANNGSLTASRNFTIAVTDVAPAVPTDADGTANSVLEGAGHGTLVGITASSSDVNGGAVTYSLTADPSGGGFAIDPNTGIVTVADPGRLDYESSGGSYQITASASDGTLTTSQDFTIAVTNAAPATPVDTDYAADSVLEGAANGTVVGITALSSDPNGPPVTYSLTADSSGGGFAIDPNSGIVTVADGSKLDYEAAQQATITITASDGALTSAQDFTIQIADANDNAPVITSGGVAGEPENTPASSIVYTASASDADTVGTVSFALTGDDAGKFSINPSTGAVRFLTSPDYENPGSAANNNSYQLILHANDGVQDVTKQLVIDVTDVPGVTITGTNGNDNINATHTVAGQPYPTSEADTIRAGKGNDTIAGLGGGDILDGGPGTDTVTYVGTSAGINVSLVTGIGHGGDAEGDTLINIENLTGTAFADTIEGSSGDNVLIGGAGTDTLSYEHASAGVTVSLAVTTAQNTGSAGSDTVTNFENLTGSAFDDVLTGSALANILVGGAGNDTLDGGKGADTMIGGSGDDTYIVDSAADVVSENPGEGTDTVKASLSYGLGANLENLVLTGTTNVNATGNEKNNVLTGNSGNNILAGLAGADTLDGGAGTDTASYAASPSGVNVSLATGFGSGGDAEGDTLANIENLTGSAASDTLEGNGGDNAITGGGGIDTVTYAHALSGVTVGLAVNAAQNTIGAGSDTLKGFANLTGSGFDDALTGSSGANVIIGGDGNDTLTGAGGADILTGGAGSDIFVYGTASQSTGVAYDTITDFDALQDKFKFNFAVPDLNAAVTTGTLSDASFDSDLTAALGTKQLKIHDAVLFTPNSGSLAGQTFLVVDTNGHAGYQAGADTVIRLNNPTNLASLAVANFTH